MKTCFLNFLTYLGLGINGVIMSPEHFADRFKSFANNCDIIIVSANDEQVTYHVMCADQTSFNIVYTLNNKRIVDVNIVDSFEI